MDITHYLLLHINFFTIGARSHHPSCEYFLLQFNYWWGSTYSNMSFFYQQVNDGAVMMNWAKSSKTGLSMLTFLGDPNSEFTRATDLELTDPRPIAVLGPGRCKRFAMHVVDGIIKAVNVSETEDDPTGDDSPKELAESFADGIMATMK